MSEALRIAIVLERFEPARGGTERYAAELVRRLRRRGHDVTVVANRIDRDALHGAPHRVVAVPAFSRAWRVWAFARRAARLTKGRYDIVHGLQKSLGHTVFQPHTGSHRGTLAAVRRALPSAGARLVHRVGKWLSLKQWVFAAIEKRQYRQRPAPVFLAISPLVRRQMLELHGVQAGHVQLLPNPVDGDVFKPPDPQARAKTRALVRSDAGEAKRIALFVGNEPRLKGLREAMACWPDAFDELWVVGRGLDARPSWLTVPSGTDAGAVRFLGQQDDMSAIYGAADALLFPTAYDPAPLVVLEALSCGLRVLTTEACGLADLVRGSGGEVVADRNDAAALKAAAARLAAAPRPTARFRTELLELHAWEVHLERLEAIYRAAPAAP